MPGCGNMHTCKANLLHEFCFLYFNCFLGQQFQWVTFVPTEKLCLVGCCIHLKLICLGSISYICFLLFSVFYNKVWFGLIGFKLVLCIMVVLIYSRLKHVLPLREQPEPRQEVFVWKNLNVSNRKEKMYAVDDEFCYFLFIILCRQIL